MHSLQILFGSSSPSRLHDRHHSCENEQLMSENLESGQEKHCPPTTPEGERIQVQGLLYKLFGVLLFFCYSIGLIFWSPWPPSDNDCGRQLSVWSPMNDAVEYIEYDLDNEFDHKSEYRGPPTPELEAAWDRIWRFDAVPYPVDKLPSVNRSATLSDGRKLAPIGGGKEGVAANFEVFHQLHCINLIRQYTWRDYYLNHPELVETPPDMLASDVGVRMHVDHCIEHVRLALMCHGDTTPFFTIIDEEAPLGARSDFSPHHKCKDFRKLKEWVLEEGVWPDLTH